MLVRLQRLLLPSWAIMLINKAGRGLTWSSMPGLLQRVLYY